MLKLVKPGMDSAQVVRRFEAERQTLALMAHPSIAQLFDGGATEDGRPYFVMEYVDGEPLTDHCDRRRLPTRARLELLLSACDGVQHAHQKGVISESGELVRSEGMGLVLVLLPEDGFEMLARRGDLRRGQVDRRVHKRHAAPLDRGSHGVEGRVRGAYG